MTFRCEDVRRCSSAGFIHRHDPPQLKRGNLRKMEENTCVAEGKHRRTVNPYDVRGAEEMWGAIADKLKSERHSQTLDVRAGTFCDGTNPGLLADSDEPGTASPVEEDAERGHPGAIQARAAGRRACTRTIEATCSSIRDFSPVLHLFVKIS